MNVMKNLGRKRPRIRAHTQIANEDFFHYTHGNSPKFTDYKNPDMQDQHQCSNKIPLRRGRRWSAAVTNTTILLALVFSSSLNTSVADETNNMFCGTSWGDASNNCDERQHCPGGTDDECETEGHICFGGTSCDSKLGHGNKFKYANLPYNDISNTRFCGSGWNDAIESCSIQTHCPSGFSDECPGGMSCYGGLSCNVQDMLEELEENGGTAADAANKIPKHDERRSQFCGISWGDANSKCGQWCPSGEDTDCPGGMGCFGNTECYYDDDLVPTQTPVKITEPPFTGAPIPYNDAGNTRFCGTSWGMASAECSIESSCPSGDSDDCPKGQTCHGGTSCNLSDLLKKANKPDVPTPAPTMPPVTRDDPSNSRFCGSSWTQASDNCSMDTHCPDGECPNGMICYGGISSCNAYDLTATPTKQPTPGPTGNPTFTPTAPTVSPTSVPSSFTKAPITGPPTSSPMPTGPPIIPADDPRHSYWCGMDWADVTENCAYPCVSGQDEECPEKKMTCFAFTTCRPPPPETDPPTYTPTSPLEATNHPVSASPTTKRPTKANTKTMTPAAMTISIQTEQPIIHSTQQPSQSPSQTATFQVVTSSPSLRRTDPPTAVEIYVTMLPTSIPTAAPLPMEFVQITDNPTMHQAEELQSTTPETESPTIKPTIKPTDISTDLIDQKSNVPPPSAELMARVGNILTMVTSEMNKKVLIVQDAATGKEATTKLYQYEGFVSAVGVYSKGDMGTNYFYLGQGDVSAATNYGLVNAAIFLSQATIQTVSKNICDEFSWEKDVFGRYPIANACGQGKFGGLSDVPYEEANPCSKEESFMACQVDPGMTATAVTFPQWAGAPPPLECFPKTTTSGTGAWDSFLTCTDDGCNHYEGQVKGKIDPNSVPTSNSFGRNDVEGCCWWGRGAFPRGSAGTCSIGKLNHHLGSLRYKKNLCQDPSAICRGVGGDAVINSEVRWLMGMQYWVDKIQTYNKDGWSYIDKLHDFVNKGLADMEFFDDVSRIITRNCHIESTCGKPVEGYERRSVFEKIIDILSRAQTGKLDEIEPTLQPTEQKLKATSASTDVPTKPRTTPPFIRPVPQPSATAMVAKTGVPISMAPVTNEPSPSPISSKTTQITLSPTSTELTSLSLQELSNRFKFANNYCAKSLQDAEDNCGTAAMKTCNAGDSPCSIGTACFGNVLCTLRDSESDKYTEPSTYKDTGQGTDSNEIENGNAATICGGVCLVPLDVADCPVGDAANAFLPDCLSIAVGGVCEGTGECGTSAGLNNCGQRDIYTREFFEKCSSRSDSTSFTELETTLSPSLSPSDVSSGPPSGSPINASDHPSSPLLDGVGVNDASSTVGDQNLWGYSPPDSFELKDPENEPDDLGSTWWTYVPKRSGAETKRISAHIKVAGTFLLHLFLL